MVTALISAGVALRRAKRHAEAIECYREAVTLAPKHAVAWANLGNATKTGSETFIDYSPPMPYGFLAHLLPASSRPCRVSSDCSSPA